PWGKVSLKAITISLVWWDGGSNEKTKSLQTLTVVW
ncbi:unnamed protein product, partial [marine sediment metagenome]